jgi:hypothetical protein
MSNDLIYLDDLLEGLRKINIEKGDIHVYLALLL